MCATQSLPDPGLLPRQQLTLQQRRCSITQSRLQGLYLEHILLHVNTWGCMPSFLPPAYRVRREGYVLTRVCPSVCPQEGGVSQLTQPGVGVRSSQQGGGQVQPAGGGSGPARGGVGSSQGGDQVQLGGGLGPAGRGGPARGRGGQPR